MGGFSQFRLLLWKNFLVQKRQIYWTIFELVLPVFFSLILIILRQQVISSQENETTYDPFYVDGSPFDFYNFSVTGQPMFGPLFYPNKIFYAPNTSFINEIMKKVANRYSFNFTLPVRVPGIPHSYKMEITGFPNEDDMVTELIERFDIAGTNNTYFGGIVFYGDFVDGNQSYDSEKSIKYAIRLSNVARNPLIRKKTDNGRPSLGIDQTWDTKLTYPTLQLPGPRQKFAQSGGKPGYWREGFLTLQRAIDVAITETIQPESQQFLQRVQPGLDTSIWPPKIVVELPKVEVKLNRFPYPPYVDNPFIMAVQRNLPLVIMISLALSVLYITRTVVQEKEKRLKEYMRAMGLSGWQHWMAHFITNYSKVVIAVALITLLLKIPVRGKTVITETDGTLIFVFLLLYGACAVWFSFTVSVFFKKGNTAAGCGFVVWFFLYLPWFFIQPRYSELSYAQKLASCLVLNTAMAFGAQVIGIYEGEGTGLQWGTFATPGTIDDNFTMAHVFAMMVVDMVLCMLITWYVEAIYPGDEGVPEKPWFPFQITYWKPSYLTRRDSLEAQHPQNDSINTVSGSHAVESDPPDMEPVIELEGLTKIYGSMFRKKRVLAVNNLSLKMFAGQVTAILGHNGSGKSTTLSMLTGIIPPSSGTAKINGCDIRTRLASARKHLGICPQYNALFDHLTVEEHLEFFCKLKDRVYLKTEVTRLLAILALAEKRNSLAKTLSGGMKRKLLVAIALIGGSEIVMLDEPTSGMDPGARHEAWRLVQAEKYHRTILLTTHFMEEADLLGDKIAIIARGQLQCCGTSFFLKNLYGAGYHITVVFGKSDMQDGRGEERCSRSEAVLQVLHQHCPEAEAETSVGMEATFLLPASEREKFESMLHDLETNQDALAVSSFGVSITTMEEVFLKVGKLADERLSSTTYNTFHNVSTHDSSQPICDDVIQPSVINAPSSSASSVSGLPVSPFTSSDQLLDVGSLKGGLFKGRHNPFDDQKYLIEDGDDRSVFVSSASAAELFFDDSEAIPLDVLSSRLSINMNDFQAPYRNTGARLQFQQFYAMFLKRVIHSFRNVLVLVAQFLVPAFVMAVALLINKTFPGPSLMPPLNVNLRPFGHTVVPIWINSSTGAGVDPKPSGLASALRDFLAFRNSTVSLETVPRGMNMSAFLLAQYRTMGTYTVNQQLIFGGGFCEEDSNNTIPIGGRSERPLTADLVGYFNNQPFHSPPIALNLMDNTILNYFRSQANKSKIGIETVNHPLPPTSMDKLQDWLAVGVKEFNIAFNLVFGMAFLSSSFVVFLVNERRTKAKHMQFLSGVHPANFWLATFVWDFLNYLVPTLLIFLLFFLFHIKYLIGSGRWDVTLLILVMHGWAMLPMIYAISFFFTSAPGAFVKVTIFQVFSGPVALTVTTILYVLELYDVYKKLEWIFLSLFPSFCLGQAFNEFYMNEFVKDQCQPLLKYCNMTTIPNCCPESESAWVYDSLQWVSPGIGRMQFFLGIQGLVFWSLIILIEIDLLRKVRYFFTNLVGAAQTRKKKATENYDRTQGSPRLQNNSVPKDSDVEQEREKVLQSTQWDCALLVKDLVKDYGSLRAVDEVSFAVKVGECFGLLGVNGAGKTSTFQMLTGENLITQGTATLAGVDVQKNWRRAGKNVGYCPQFDAVIDQLTGAETLFMFGRLRGIPENKIKSIVHSVIRAVGISKYKDRQVHTYSGGNKRRLSLGIALVGSPPVLLLDEPTTGVDPAARRAIWNVLSQIRHQGTGLVLTSHSMEECEALCTRLAIMVAGQFRCLGSPQHLKGKFGAGYSLQAKVQSTNDLPHAVRTIATSFPGSTLKEVHHTQLLYELPCMEGMSWSQLFGMLEKLLGPLKIVDYALSQTTLEQVFLGFSREVYGNQIDSYFSRTDSAELGTDYI